MSGMDAGADGLGSVNGRSNIERTAEIRDDMRGSYDLLVLDRSKRGATDAIAVFA
jgi:hypothetical protein